MGTTLIGLATTVLALLAGIGAAQEPPGDLRSLSLEELLNVEVSSVSRRLEPVFDAAAAVYVVTSEEIRRSGARELPEILRLVPGLHVARIDGSRWAVSSRGFASRFSNKLQVLIDGRTIYTPLFSNVYWNQHQLVAEDIDRIEVIRGPGGTLWGANAVTGVINVITKRAAETQGTLVVAGGGSIPSGFTSLRHGGTTSAGVAYRAYGNLVGQGAFEPSLPGLDGADDGWAFQGGFRADWNRGPDDRLTLRGDVLAGEEGQLRNPPMTEVIFPEHGDIGGGNVGFLWEHDMEDGSRTSVRAHYDLFDRSDILPSETRHTGEVEAQHLFTPGSRHQVVVGGGYRVTRDIDVDVETFPAGDRTLHFANAYVQDEIRLLPDRLALILGSKFEQNSLTGLELQPTARLLLELGPRSTIWAAVSRAVRTPSRGEDDSESEVNRFEDPDTGLQLLTRFDSDSDLEAESLIAYEVGYRFQASERFYLDATAFVHDYDDLVDVEISETEITVIDGVPTILIPLRWRNRLTGIGHGGELFIRSELSRTLQVAFGYSYLDLELQPDAEFPLTDVEGKSPRHQAQFRTYLDLPRGIELDGALYLVDDIPAFALDGYARLDLRLGWTTPGGAELSLALRNLLEDEHQEFGTSGFGLPGLVPRSAHATVRWRF